MSSYLLDISKYSADFLAGQTRKHSTLALATALTGCRGEGTPATDSIALSIHTLLQLPSHCGFSSIIVYYLAAAPIASPYLSIDSSHLYNL
ncbi:uncharacterized protein LAJ45_01494 [Morchella importuna]|uniref:uncharacterized protein n=1 Tax=Morchella importuna TaxID=1174673 RepID=UPI001E8D2096|nr:uncharacterized protein LAJ45_01494 [Morchella importuna]KAH8154961.1 hypothetical protein LAJ45_01494 [Morchella importuna]